MKLLNGIAIKIHYGGIIHTRGAETHYIRDFSPPGLHNPGFIQRYSLAEIWRRPASTLVKLGIGPGPLTRYVLRRTRVILRHYRLSVRY